MSPEGSVCVLCYIYMIYYPRVFDSSSPDIHLLFYQRMFNGSFHVLIEQMLF
jgi:hypothetical protein